MPVPSAITDLSTTAGSNSPSGSDNVFPDLDNYVQAYASFIALLRDGNGSAAEVSLASGATTDIGAQTSPFVRITGTTTITSFGTNYVGAKFLRFASSLTLTHNATTLILPGQADIVAQSNDVCIAIPYASGWRVLAYTRYDNAPVLVASGTHTPTLTNTTNIDSSTASLNQYSRVGDIVTMSGRVVIDPTATGSIEMGMTIPVASDFSSGIHAGGTFCSIDGVDTGAIYADATNNRLTFAGTVSATTSKSYSFHVTYRIL